jgi:hypothetical protein
MKYNWPKTKFVHENSPGEQLHHIFSEAQEIKKAIGDKEPQERVREEIYDLLHSLETWVRIQEQEHGAWFVEQEMRKAGEKNLARGYYANYI